jgi:hypothetical protein
MIRWKIIFILLIPIYSWSSTPYFLPKPELSKKCHKVTKKLATKHEENGLLYFNQYQSKIKNILKKSTADQGSKQQILNKASSKYSLESSFKKFVFDFVDVLKNDITNETCDRKNLESLSEKSLKFYKEILDRSKYYIEYRVELESLDADEGLAIISAYSYGYAGRIEINPVKFMGDSMSIGPLNNSQYFRIAKLKAGEYQWGRIKVYGPMSLSYRDFSDANLKFKIQPGKLNYTGVFIHEVMGMYAKAEIFDKAAVITTMIEQDYPLLLNKYELVNGLIENDPFINFYLTQKKKLKSGN